MIQVHLSINNNEEVIQLPVPPEEYSVTSPWNNGQVDGLQRSINRIGTRSLCSLDIKSFFPSANHNYPFLQNTQMWGMEYVETIERWRSLRIPVRIVIVDTTGEKVVNMAVTIDDFQYGMKTDGDIFYTLKFTEFALPSTRR